MEYESVISVIRKLQSGALLVQEGDQQVVYHRVGKAPEKKQVKVKRAPLKDQNGDAKKSFRGKSNGAKKNVGRKPIVVSENLTENRAREKKQVKVKRAPRENQNSDAKQSLSEKSTGAEQTVGRKPMVVLENLDKERIQELQKDVKDAHQTTAPTKPSISETNISSVSATGNAEMETCINLAVTKYLDKMFSDLNLAKTNDAFKDFRSNDLESSDEELQKVLEMSMLQKDRSDEVGEYSGAGFSGIEDIVNGLMRFEMNGKQMSIEIFLITRHLFSIYTDCIYSSFIVRIGFFSA